MTKRHDHLRCMLLCIVALVSTFVRVQAESPESIDDVHVRVQFPKSHPHEHAPPAVLWLKPLPGTSSQTFLPNGRYTLLQKNRMFTPHLLIVPIGSEVHFPNADPFFHNVFSLFNGKRFDLGLYESGTDKEVMFSREGVSYIFCNIHPEMSAVILVLSTPFYATAKSLGAGLLGTCCRTMASSPSGRVVVDGNLVTAGGITAGIDCALVVTSLVRGEQLPKIQWSLSRHLLRAVRSFHSGLPRN